MEEITQERDAMFIKGEYYCVLVKPEYMHKLFKCKALKALCELQLSSRGSMDYFDKEPKIKKEKLKTEVNSKQSKQSKQSEHEILRPQT